VQYERRFFNILKLNKLGKNVGKSGNISHGNLRNQATAYESGTDLASDWYEGYHKNRQSLNAHKVNDKPHMMLRHKSGEACVP